MRMKNWIFKKWRVNFKIMCFLSEDKKDLKARSFLRLLSNILSYKYIDKSLFVYVRLFCF